MVRSNPRTRRAGRWVFAHVATALLSASVCTAGTGTVSPTAPAALNSNYVVDFGSDLRPSIATSVTGTAIAVWQTNDTLGGSIPASAGNVVASRSVDDGAAWSPLFPLTGTANRSSNPKVATDGEGVWIVVFNSRIPPGANNIEDIFFCLSADDGITWSAPAPLNLAHATTSSGNELSPAIVSLGDGEWVVAWESTTPLIVNGVSIGTDSDILVSRSENNGATWTTPTPIRLGYAAGVHGNDIAVQLASDGEGRVVAVWSSTDDLVRFNETDLGLDSDILVARSSSRGINWSFPQALNSFASIDRDGRNGSPSDNDVEPTIATDGMGAWMVAWASFYGGASNEFQTGDRDIWHSVSVKEGDLWSAASPLVPSFAEINANDFEPSIGTDALGNWIVVWRTRNPLGTSGQPAIGTDDDLVYSFSNTTGALWTYPAPLNTNAPTDDPWTDSAPTLGVDRSGRWIVIWVSNNPSFGGADNDLLYTSFLSPVVEVLWIVPNGGIFSNPASWDAGRVPGIFDRAAFDDTLVPQSLGPTYTVTVDAPTVTGRLAVRTGQVTLNLNASYDLDAAASKASQPPLIVGEYPDVPAVALNVRRSLGGSDFQSLRAEAASIARRNGSIATLQVENARANLALTVGPTSVGERGAGTLRATNGATMDIAGDIVMGEFAGSSGRVEVRGDDTTMGFGGTIGAPARIVVGAAGVGVWSIGDPAEPTRAPLARQLAGAPVDEVVLGAEASGEGTLRVSGDGASLTSSARRFIIGAQGNATMTVERGGLLETNSPELVALAESAGSTARVDVRDEGSMWFESSQAINIGLLGEAVATVGEGAAIGSGSSVNVLRNGTLIGDGAILGPLQNTGVVRVGAPTPGATTPGAFGVLTVEGRYSQLGAPISGTANSGSLFLRLGGDVRGVTYDAVDVIGDAFLGGGLFVSIDPSYASQGGPAIGQAFNLLDATVRDPNQPIFDVAVVPGFLDNRLFRVEYQGGEVVLEVSTLGRVLGFAEPDGSETIDGAPAGIVIANFDRDPDNLPDLVIPVAGATRLLYLLRNRGVDPITSEWLGFDVNVQSLDVAGVPPGVPVAIGVGDFLVRNGFESDLVIAFADGDSGSVAFFNNVDATPGVFQIVEPTFALGATPRGLAVGDLNADGLADVAVVSYNDAPGGTGAVVDRLVAQPANVHVQAPSLGLPGAGRPEDVDIDDLDNDKDILLGQTPEADIVIADAGLRAVLVLRNNGAGEFTDAPIVIDAGASVNELRIADLNGDGLLDVVALSSEGGVASVVINRPMAGEFAPSVPVDVGANPRSLILADLGGSESIDIAALVDGDAPGDRVIRTFRGEVAFDAITFSDGPEFPTDAGALLLAAVDVNGGEGADLIVLGGPDELRGRGTGFAETLLNAECLGDATGDGEVGFTDLNAVLSTFGQSGANLIGDVDRNGVVSFADLNTVLGQFGRRCR